MCNRLHFSFSLECLKNIVTFDYLHLMNHNGIWSQVRPSKSLPVLFLFLPPHCLKKNGTPLSRHCSRISRTHSGSIGRADGPDSPPTMTQSIPASGSSGIGPSNGSRERNFIKAPVLRRFSMRKATLWSSTSLMTKLQFFICMVYAY